MVQGMLLLPLLQFGVKWFPEKPLQGAVALEQDVRFSVTAWENESFQHGKEKYLNQAFGFRNFLVRINNQLYYSILDIAKAKGVVVGKNGYLFEETYINDYLGASFVGQERVKDVVRRLSAIDSIFETMNKTFVVVFSPGKASFYPEFIPEQFKRVNDSTNYKSYRQAILQAGIPFIDFNSYFLSMKSSSRIPLYPKTGIHWSDYGAILAMDSINTYLGQVRGYDPVELYWEEFNQNDSVSDIDADIEYGMNLLFSIDKPRYRYPLVKFDDNGSYRPKVMVIGDSFYRNLFFRGVSDKLFDNPGFGYYFKEIHSPFIGGVNDVNAIDVRGLLDNYEVIMLMVSEATMLNFPYDFDKIVYGLYCTDLSDPEVFKVRVQQMENNIRNSPEWLKSVTEKAKANNKSVDEMIHIDALYMIQQQIN
jgi:hypothetical protein